MDIDRDRSIGSNGVPAGRFGPGNGNMNGRRETTQTTFSDMMERADLGAVRRGDGYVQTPPRRWN
jgi:hypothetical protein